MSWQLRLLREAGLVVDHRLVGDSRGALYSIDSRPHGAITAWLAGTHVAGTLDPAAAAGIPRGRRTANDPWSEWRFGPRQRGDPDANVATD